VEFLFVMDPLERVDVAVDTTYALIRAACARGHPAHVVAPDQLWLDQGRPMASSRRVQAPAGEAPFAYAEAARSGPVDAFPIVWLRPDPPFDIPYLELTWLLDLVDRGRTQVVNDPSGVRAANEKLLTLRFPDLCPPTLVTADTAALRAFVERHGEAVLKPLEASGGAGILFASASMRGLSPLLEVATAGGRRCLAQAYLPKAAQGDKRILLLDGEVLGAVNRVHAPGEERNNLHLGGTAQRATLTLREEEIVSRLRPTLHSLGLWFVGLDVIDGHLTEVNVTSPTGVQELFRLEGIDAADQAIAWCERRAPRR
jgi:glutathione synthase